MSQDQLTHERPLRELVAAAVIAAAAHEPDHVQAVTARVMVDWSHKNHRALLPFVILVADVNGHLKVWTPLFEKVVPAFTKAAGPDADPVPVADILAEHIARQAATYLDDPTGYDAPHEQSAIERQQGRR